MSIQRTQYITFEELNEILGVSNYSANDNLHICEASENIKYILFNNDNEIENWNTSNTPDLIKIATAYQFKYMEQNELFDDEYTDESFSLGKFSINDTTNLNDSKKISKKALQYLIESGYINRRV
jgi:hypothetical protein